jgi:hypothetical protein
MESMQAQLGESFYIGFANISSDYMLSDIPTARPSQSTTLSKASITADGIDSANILNAPIGATVTITGPVNGSSTIDGTDSFLTTVAGSYNLKITLFPYLDWSATIAAN